LGAVVHLCDIVVSWSGRKHQ